MCWEQSGIYDFLPFSKSNFFMHGLLLQLCCECVLCSGKNVRRCLKKEQSTCCAKWWRRFLTFTVERHSDTVAGPRTTALPSTLSAYPYYPSSSAATAVYFSVRQMLPFFGIFHMNAKKGGGDASIL